MRSFTCSLRGRILLAQIGLLVFLGGSVAFLIETDHSASLRRELQKRGISIARHIAQQSVQAILAQDSLALGIAAGSQKKAEEDIVYIFFLGPEGNEVLGHSFGDTFPTTLLDLNPLLPGEPFAIRQLLTENGPIYDVAVPVANGGLGRVRLGISALPVERAVDRLTGEILMASLLAVVIGLLLAFPLTATVIHPLRRLTQAAETAAQGELEQEVAAGGRDEVSQLARSFNRMLRHLREAQEELLQSNRELSAEIGRRRQAESRLAAQFNFLSTLMDELPCPVFFKDTQGRYLGCNQAFEKFTGFLRDDIVGRQSLDFMPPEEAALHIGIDEELFVTPGTRRYEGELTQADGARRQILAQKATFTGEDGHPAGLVGVLLDMTAERETERMRSEFVSTAAHEFQTPLAAILGFCEVLLRDGTLDEESRREYLSIIQERGGYLSRLVRQMLDVSRIEAGCGIPLSPTLCHLEPLFSRLVQTYEQQGSGHDFRLILPADCPPLLIDEDRFSQILDNLLSNAVKYSPEGSRIQIEVSVCERFLRIGVQDQGRGLTADQCQRIFDKFYRVHTDNTAPAGTGLGLFITRSLVEAHGGRIEAHSAPGEGTCMAAYLPMTPGADPAIQVSLPR